MRLRNVVVCASFEQLMLGLVPSRTRAPTCQQVSAKRLANSGSKGRAQTDMLREVLEHEAGVLITT
jgi:hypothetical protein